MSIEELLENLTIEEIEELKKLKLQKNKAYNFSSISFQELNTLVEIDRVFEHSIFKSWFDNANLLSKEDIEFLDTLIKKHIFKIDSYNEEDLKVKFITPILNRVDFNFDDKKIRDFYEEKLKYENERFSLYGISDFMVASGLKYPKKPYFFIQEFKKSKPNQDPEIQLIAELICAIEINNFQIMRGAYIVGSIWNFIILEKLGQDSYQYYVSQNFDSTKIDSLKGIYKNLLFVKQEIGSLL